MGNRCIACLDPAQQGVEGALADDAHLEAHLHQAVLAGHDARQSQPHGSRRRVRLAAELACRRRVGAGVRRKAGGVHQRPHHAGLGRDVQMLAAAGAFALVEGDHRVGGGLSAGVERRLRHRAHRHRRAVRVALQAHQAASRFDGEVGGWRSGHRAGNAEGGDGDVDQMRERRAEVRRVAGFQEHVRVLEMRFEVVPGQRLLAGANAGCVGVAHADGLRRGCRGVEPPHVGAELGQGAAGEFAPVPGRVDNADVGQRRCGVLGSVAGCVGRHEGWGASRGLSPITPSASRPSISASSRPSSSDSTSRLCWPRVGAVLSMSKGRSPSR